MQELKTNLLSLIGVAESCQGGRPENQDDFGAQDTPLGFLVIVCDGMGGGPGGKTASYIVKTEILQILNDCEPTTPRETALKMAATKANDSLMDQMRLHPELSGMGATFVAILINKQSAFIAFAGDSRCYRINKQKIIFRTQDHSLVGELVRSKAMTEEEARISPQSNVVSRGLGSIANHVPEIIEVPFAKGDKFILCTDGIWGSMPHKDLQKYFLSKMNIKSIASNLSEKIDELGKKNGGHHDNHTIAIIEMECDSTYQEKGVYKNITNLFKRNNQFIMNILKKFFFTCFFSLNCLGIDAQTVIWQMPLRHYDTIEYWGNNLWKVTQKGKFGLIKPNGTIIAPIENDNISDFYEHKAILTTNEIKGERVMGCLTDDGQYYRFKKICYTLAGQKFFSDDLLSVSDENGDLGYVDCNGNPIIGFNGKYDRIKPFTEGYATVFKNRKYQLIGKDGLPVRFLFNGVGEVYGGTNVYNGLAYIWDTEGRYYTYDTRKGGVCKSTKITNAQQGFDYLYRFIAISKQTKNIPFVTINKQTAKGIAPSMNNGLYGYTIDEKEIIPYQFTHATQFENGYAVVTINNQKGILKYIDGEFFNTTVSASSIYYHEGETVDCKFLLSIPSIWQGKELTISLKDRDQTLATQKEGSTFHFRVKPTSKEKHFLIEIEGEGLILYSTTLSYTFIKKERCHECGKDKGLCPYNGHHPIKNNSKSTKSTSTNTKIEHKKEIKKCPTCGKPINRCPYQGVH